MLQVQLLPVLLHLPATPGLHVLPLLQASPQLLLAERPLLIYNVHWRIFSLNPIEYVRKTVQSKFGALRSNFYAELRVSKFRGIYRL